MKKSVRALLSGGLLSALLAWTAVGDPVGKGEDMFLETILKLEDSAMEEWRKGNPTRWAEISAADVIYIDPGLAAPIVGKEAYLRYLEPLKGTIFYDASEYVEPRVAVYGHTAVLTYNYHSLGKDPEGRPLRTSFWNTTEIYRLIDGVWRIIHTHWSYIQHCPPDDLEMMIPVLVKGAEPWTGPAAEIMGLETRALERWRKGDPAGLLALYAPDATYFDADTPCRLSGYPELKKEFEARMGKTRFDVMEFVSPRLQLFEDAAVLFYQFLATSLNPDGTVRSRGPWNRTEVYAKTDGAWKIVHSHWSYIKGWREGGGI